MASRRQTILNVGSNWTTLVLSAVVSFFLAPFIVNRLGSEAYGAWALIGSLVGYLGLVDLGVRGAVTKYVATLHAAGDHEEAGRVSSAGLLFFGLAGLAAALGGVVMAAFARELFDLPPELAEPARLAILLTGFTVALSIVGGVFGGVIVALQRFDHLNVVEVALTLLRTVAVVVALQRGGGLVALATIQLCIAIVRTAIFALDVPRLYPELRVRLAGAWDRVWKVVSFGAMTSLMHVSTSLTNYSDAVIIGFFMPLEAVTFFAIASTLIHQARGVVAGISQVMAPMAGSLEGRGEMERVGHVMLTGGRLATLAIAPVLVAFVVRGETFIRLWMGEEFAEPAGGVLALLAPGLFAFAAFQVCASTMVGIGRHRGMVPAFLLEAVVNVALCVALIGPFGITGVAIGILLPRLAISLGFGPWYSRLVLGTPIRTYWWQTTVRPMLAVLPFAIACRLVDDRVPTGSLWLFFGQIAALLPLAGVGAWVLSLDAAERALVTDTVRRRWRTLGPRKEGEG